MGDDRSLPVLLNLQHKLNKMRYSRQVLDCGCKSPTTGWTRLSPASVEVLQLLSVLALS